MAVTKEERNAAMHSELATEICRGCQTKLLSQKEGAVLSRINRGIRKKEWLIP